MEVLDAVLLSVLIGASAPILSAFLKLLIALLFDVVHITEQAQISSLDRLLGETGWWPR
jgi:hypothetical protein